MDIRTKLVFALVSVALGSMLAFGAITYERVRDELQLRTRMQLDGQAESRAEALADIVRGWRERVDLIASRTQLRVSLAEYDRRRDPVEADRIGRILQDAIDASSLVTFLAVLDDAGTLVVSVARAGSGREGAWRLTTPEVTEARTVYDGLTFTEAGPRVAFSSPLEEGGTRVGTLYAVLRTSDIDDLVGNHRGLGETGETMVVARDADGTIRVLHPLRHGSEGDGGLVAGDVPLDSQSVAGLAVQTEEGLDPSIGTDYRGVRVWASTRFLPETGWGLIVKMDAVEEGRPIVRFREELTRLAVVLAAFAILLGTVLGIRFAQPVHELSEAANRIREGQLGARAPVTHEDEVGLLARTFNQMADELETQMTLLHEFRKFFDVSIDLMCIAGTDGFFKKTNPAFERVLGWTTQELLDRPFVALVHPDDVEATEREIATLARGIPTISFENRFRCRDGSYLRLRWNSYPDEATGMLYAIARRVDESSTEAF